jgi:dihydroorotate dehydrogenase (NAD+) catalytic subunit
MATSAEDFAAIVETVAGREEVAGIELNVSCPNVHSGLIVGEQPVETQALLGRLRPLTRKPLIVKLTPNVADPAAIAAAAEAAGADAVSLINTLKAAPMLAGRPWLGAGSGGLSGPAVRTIALKQVADVRAAVSIPVVGMGGVEHGSHARDLLDAGAAVVAVGTASFRDPLAAERILAELRGLDEMAAESPISVA